MSLMCSIAACKAKAGMCTHEKVTSGVIALLVVGFVVAKGFRRSTPEEVIQLCDYGCRMRAAVHAQQVHDQIATAGAQGPLQIGDAPDPADRPCL